jgi:cytochrome P450
VASWANEVQAGVHTQVNLLSSAWLLLLEHVALVLVVKELDDWLP